MAHTWSEWDDTQVPAGGSKVDTFAEGSENISDDMMMHVTSWSRARILYADFNGKRVSPVSSNDLARFDTNISPQLLLTTRLQVDQLPFAGLPKTIRGSPQSESEDSNNQSAERSEKTIMAVNEAERTDSLRFEELGDGEAGSIAALVAVVLSYAGLKRGCDFVFGPNKNSNGDAK